MMGQVFDLLFFLLHWLIAVFGGAVVLLLFALPWLWGIADMVGCKRFSDKPEYDRTAAILHWWEVKSLFATQAPAMIEKFPWLGMDLSEDRGVTPEDNEVT